MTKSVFNWVENFKGKGENAGYQHFLRFPQRFQKFPVPESLKLCGNWSQG